MKAQSPLLGFNNNVRHKGRVFHIQTEDSGIKHPHVITHLFADGGRIVRSQKTSYAEYVGDDEMQRKVRSLMQEQHKAMFIALRAGKFDHLIETVPVPEPSSPGRPPMESTVSIEVGDESIPGAVVHVAPGERPPKRVTPSAMAAASPAPLASIDAAPESTRAPNTVRTATPASRNAETQAAMPRLTPPGIGALPMAPTETAIPRQAAPIASEDAVSAGLRKLTPPPPKPAARPASIIPPAAKPLAPASVPPPPLSASDPGARPLPRKNSGLLAALGALSAGSKAPSLGASPPSSARSQRPIPRNDSLPQPSAASQGRPPAPSSLDLDLQALERAAEQGNSPVYRQVRDFPPPPQAVRAVAAPALRSFTPQPPASIAQPPPSQPNAGGRYAPSRPASIFGNAKPQEGSSIFGEDLISEKSLDEVILSYLAEDLEPGPSKK